MIKLALVLAAIAVAIYLVTRKPKGKIGSSSSTDVEKNNDSNKPEDLKV